MDYLRKFQERVALNRVAFDSVRQNTKIGTTELEMLSIIQDAWLRASCVKFPFSGDIVSGERSANIEGEPTERKLKQGDVFILDLQPGFDHCYADTTRTFFVGEPTEEIRQAYSAVVDALKQMEKLLRPGVPACKLYEKMQEVLASKGYANYYVGTVEAKPSVEDLLAAIKAKGSFFYSTKAPFFSSTTPVSRKLSGTLSKNLYTSFLKRSSLNTALRSCSSSSTKGR